MASAASACSSPSGRPADLEQALGLLEQGQALRQPARMRGHPGLALGEVRRSGPGPTSRPGPRARRSAPGPRRSGRSCASIMREVVGHLGPDVDRDVAPLAASCGRSRRPRRAGRRSGASPRSGAPAPAAPCPQQRPSAQRGRAGPSAVAPELLVHCRPDDEDLAPAARRVLRASASRAARLSSLRARSSASCARTAHQACARRATTSASTFPGSTGLGHHGLGHRPGRGGVRDGGLVGRFGPRLAGRSGRTRQVSRPWAGHVGHRSDGDERPAVGPRLSRRRCARCIHCRAERIGVGRRQPCHGLPRVQQREAIPRAR